MKIILIILGLMTSCHLIAQDKDSVVIVFEISNEDNEKINGVLVAVSQGSSKIEISTDIFGKADCKIEKFGEFNARFKHPDYAESSVIKELYNNSALDTLHYKIELISIDLLDLDEVIVTVPGIPEVVYRSQKLSVQDFQIIDQDNAILLAYPKQLKKGSRLLLYDLVNTVKDSIEIKEEAIELTRDYEGHIYLIMANGCKRIVINDNKIETLDFSLYYYRRFIEPIIGVTRRKMFFSTYDQFYPAFDYFYLDVKDSTYTKFASVIDRELMIEYRAEYRFANMNDPYQRFMKLAAKNNELATGVDAETYYGRRMFTGSIYYEAPFAPMFKVNRNLFLFDYHCDSLKVFDDGGELLFEKPITHDQDDRKKGWEKLLIQDRIKNKIYVAYQKGGYYYLHEVNLLSGELNEPIKLNHRYAEQIQVYNGFIYYVYRPFESYQKKYFWREKLPRK